MPRKKTATNRPKDIRRETNIHKEMVKKRGATISEETRKKAENIIKRQEAELEAARRGSPTKESRRMRKTAEMREFRESSIKKTKRLD